MAFSNHGIERDLAFTKIITASSTSVTSGGELKVPIVTYVGKDTIQPAGIIVFNKTENITYMSDGTNWIPLSGSSPVNVGSGVNILSGIADFQEKLRSLSSKTGTIGITVLSDDTISLDLQITPPSVTLPGTGAVSGTGNLLYANAPETIQQVSIGNAGMILKSNGSIPIWSNNTSFVNNSVDDALQIATINSDFSSPSVFFKQFLGRGNVTLSDSNGVITISSPVLDASSLLNLINGDGSISITENNGKIIVNSPVFDATSLLNLIQGDGNVSITENNGKLVITGVVDNDVNVNSSFLLNLVQGEGGISVTENNGKLVISGVVNNDVNLNSALLSNIVQGEGGISVTENNGKLVLSAQALDSTTLSSLIQGNGNVTVSESNGKLVITGLDDTDVITSSTLSSLIQGNGNVTVSESNGKLTISDTITSSTLLDLIQSGGNVSISESNGKLVISDTDTQYRFVNTGSGDGLISSAQTASNVVTVSSKSLSSDGSLDIQSTPDSIVLSTNLSKLLPSPIQGAILYTDSNKNISQLPPANSGQVLKLVDGLPEWVDLPVPVEKTVSSVGTLGSSVYKGVSGLTYEFKNIASSNTISVTEDPNNNILLSTSLNALVPDLTPGGILSVNESSNVTTLPIGQQNQLLSVNSLGNLEWKSLSNTGAGVNLLNHNTFLSAISTNNTISISPTETGEIDFTTSFKKILGDVPPLPNSILGTNDNGDMVNIPYGSQGQVLTSTSNSSYGWSDPVYPPSTSKGDGSNINLPYSQSDGYSFKSLKSDGSISVTPTSDTITLSTTLGQLLPEAIVGDILVKGAENFNPVHIGPRKYVLTSDGNNPVWLPTQSGSSATTIIVRKNASEGEFTTIVDAMKSIPDCAPCVSCPYVIKVSSGYYGEAETIVFKPYVYIVGEDIGGVVVYPLSEGYDLFKFNKATALSFCSIVGVSNSNYACVFNDTGEIGFEYSLLHKVNFYTSKVLVQSITSDTYVYFEYCAYAQQNEDDAIDVTIDVKCTDSFMSYLSIENHFVQGDFTTASVKVDGPSSYLYGQLCNFVGNNRGDGILITNGGQTDIRTSFLSNYNNALHLDLNGSNPRLTSSGVTFGDNKVNMNVKNPTASGYLFGFSEYNKTLINPSAYDTFFIANSNQRIVTVAPKGGNFTSIHAALNAINPVIQCTTSNTSNTISSNGLFNVLLNGTTVKGPGIQPGTMCSFVDESTILLSLPATATAVVELTFLRATEYTAFTILVQSGFYIEPSPMYIDEYINISGVNRDTCVCIPAVPNTSLFVIASHASISNLNITGVNPANYAVVFTDSMFSFADNIVFFQIGNAISFANQTISYVVEVRNCIFVGGTGTSAIQVNNSNPPENGIGLTVTFSDLRCFQHYDTFFDMKGFNTVAVIRNCALIGDGTGDTLRISDACRVSVQGIYIERWTRGFVTNDITTHNPYLAVEGMTNTLVSGNLLEINNPSLSGYYSGYIAHSQVHIVDDSPFFVCNKDSKIITVAKKGGDYDSIHDAINSINNASVSNIYTILVGPGIFIEPPLVMKSFTNLKGTGYMSTVIFCDDAAGAVLTGADSSLVTGFTFNGATAEGGRAIYLEGTGTAPGSPFIVENCILGSNHTLVSVNASVCPAVMVLSQCLYGATFDADEGIRVVGQNGMIASLLVYNCVFQDLVTPVPQTLLSCDGDNALLVAANTMIQLNGTNTSSGLRMRNGAGVRLYGCSVVGLQNGVISENIGNGPGLVVCATSFERCERILSIENPYTTGYFTGSVDISKSFIHPRSTFNIRDRVTNTLVVSEMGADYTSVNTAILSINPVVSVHVTAGSMNVTPAGSINFNPSMDGFGVSGSGIPPNTIFTYLSCTSGMLSNAIDSNLLSVVAAQTDIIDMTVNRSAETNPYVVYLQPGVYIEPPLTLPPYVSLEGVSKSTCIIHTSSNTSPVVILGKETSVNNLTLIGSSGGVGILVDSTQHDNEEIPAEIRNVVIKDCQQGIFITATQGPCIVKGESVLIAGHGSLGILVDGSTISSPNNITAMFNSLHINLEDNSHTSISIEGPHAKLFVNSSTIDCSNLVASTGISQSDGSTLVLNGCQIIGSTLDGLIVVSDGDAPNLQCSSCTFYQNAGKDIHIQHPATNGCITMATAQTSKVSIIDGCPITVSYVDPAVNGITMLGTINIGQTVSESANVYPILTDGQTMGVIEGGVLSKHSDVELSITKGTGYVCSDATQVPLIYVSWSDTTLTILNSQTINYIYVSSAGIVSAQSSKQTHLDYIYLGRVIVESGVISIVENTAMSAHHTSNKYDDFHRTALGAVVSSGIITTVSNKAINISSGTYFLSGVKLDFPGFDSALSSVVEYYHNSSTWQTLLSSTPFAIDNASYDNLSSLGLVSEGYYIKHSVYCTLSSGLPKVMLVYAQSQYETEDACLGASSPIPPSYFGESIIHLSDVIVQQGNDTYSKVIDSRPVITSKISAITSTLVHGNLQGLLEDDHPQYLRVDGARTISGTLNVGNNDMVGVKTINGIDYSQHASRHLPNGTDPLTTASPSTSLSCGSTNYEGVANSFARSDHTHKILTGVSVTQNPDQPNQEGTSTSFARSDHIHNIPTDIAVDISTSNREGTSSSFARSDHTHLGVRSISSGNSQMFGDVSLSSGNGIAVNVSSNNMVVSTTIGANEFVPSIQSGLSISITQGRIILPNMTVLVVNTSTLTLPASTSGVIFVDYTGTFKSRSGTTFGRGECPIATFTSLSSSISQLVDVRVSLGSHTGTHGNGCILYVDSVYGHNPSASRNGTPYSSIDVALSNAQSGDIVFLFPGTYNINSGLVIPSGISLVGMERDRCIVSVATTINLVGITLNDSSCVFNIKLIITSSTPSILITGILFSNTSTNSARVRETTVVITNTSTAETNIYGIRSNGTNTNDRGPNIELVYVIINSNGSTGVLRGLMCDSSSIIVCIGSKFEVNSSIGHGIEVRNGGYIRKRGGEIKTTTSGNEILKTSGTVDCVGTQTSRGVYATRNLLVDDDVITLPNGSDALVNINANQNIYNKTLTDPSNVLSASYLRTTGNDVRVSQSAPPVLGYVLTASSPTSASWSAPVQLVQGNGISIANNTVSNTGILSLSNTDGLIGITNNSGNVVLSSLYVAGNGINITGTTISTSGVLNGISAANSTILVGGTSTNPTLSANYTAGVGITIDGGVITNTSPASGVSLNSAGGTYSLISSISGSTFNLKGLTPGVGITIGVNSTGVTISNASPASSVVLSNAGIASGTNSLVSRGTGPSIATKGLVAGSGISITSNTTDITLSCSAVNSVTAGNSTILVGGTSTAPTISCNYVGGSGVTISGNTISASGVVNVSAGNSTVLVGGTTNNPTISGNYVGGTGIVIIGNTIVNSSPASAIALSSVGLASSTQSLVVGGLGSNLSLKGIASGNGISLSGTTISDIVISNTGVNSISGGSGITISGSSTNPIVSLSYALTGGSGITISGSSTNPVISNTGVNSISGGSGITISGTTTNPIVSSSYARPQLSFCAPGKYSAYTPSYKPIAYFTWIHSLYSNLSGGTIIYSVSAANVNIRIYNTTTSTVLGSDVNVSSTGIRSFTFTNPSADANLEIQIAQSTTSIAVISGVQWFWNM